MFADRTFHSGFLANGSPLIGAGRRVSGLALFVAPADRVYIFSAAKITFIQSKLVLYGRVLVNIGLSNGWFLVDCCLIRRYLLIHNCYIFVNRILQQTS
ncbi:hypothetical protein D3C81_1654020 [compost metagenome]